MTTPPGRESEGWHSGQVPRVTRKLESWRRHVRDGKPKPER